MPGLLHFLLLKSGFIWFFFKQMHVQAIKLLLFATSLLLFFSFGSTVRSWVLLDRVISEHASGPCLTLSLQRVPWCDVPMAHCEAAAA